MYLNARAHLHLKQYLESRADDNPAPLFVGTRAPHKRLTKSGIRNILKKVGNAAGVSKVHPHRFRRTSATDLLRMGMPIEQVQELLGHVKIETTRIYCTVTKRAGKGHRIVALWRRDLKCIIWNFFKAAARRSKRGYGDKLHRCNDAGEAARY